MTDDLPPRSPTDESIDHRFGGFGGYAGINPPAEQAATLQEPAKALPAAAPALPAPALKTRDHQHTVPELLDRDGSRQTCRTVS